MQKVHFRLTSVAQKRCCLSSLMSILGKTAVETSQRESRSPFPLWFCAHVRGGSRFNLGADALVSCSTSTPINHIVFFLQNTSCIRKPQVISGGGGGAHPLHPPLRSAPARLRKKMFAGHYGSKSREI